MLKDKKEMYIVTGILISTTFVASSLAGDWCNTVDGLEYCENGCCDDDDEFWLDKCCVMPLWAIIVLVLGSVVAFVVVACVLCYCCKRATERRGIQPVQGAPMQISTVQNGYQPSSGFQQSGGFQQTGFQQHPYPSGHQPPPGGAMPTAPPPAYNTVYGQQDYSSQFGIPAPAPNPAFPPKH